MVSTAVFVRVTSAFSAVASAALNFYCVVVRRLQRELFLAYVLCGDISISTGLLGMG